MVCSWFLSKKTGGQNQPNDTITPVDSSVLSDMFQNPANLTYQGQSDV